MRSNVKNPNLIVRNAVFLFLRLLFVMAIAFYTTRLTLQILGDENYGINNIVGGLISVFAMISMPITGALQRFFNVEFTKQEIPSRVVFSSSLWIIMILAIGMTVLYETVGLYLVNHVLNYPEERSFAVNIIFQLTIISTVVHFFTLSYSSLLYAKEDMGVPAIVEIVGAVLKLALLFTIPLVSVDVLIAYSAILLLISIIQLSIYIIYCKLKHEEAKWVSTKDTKLQGEILKFAGWSSVGSVAGISLTYLSNIFINIFGGVLYNTAYGISSQLSNAVVSFATNVMKAVDPQITSATVAEQNSYRDQLTLTAIKISFLAIGFCYVVFFFYGQELLELWLGHVPAYVNEFCRISLLNILFTSVVLPLRTIVLATGKIKNLFLNYGFMALVANVAMYVLLKMGWPVITVMYLIMLVNVCYFMNVIIIVSHLSTLKAKTVLLIVIKCIALLLISGLLFFLMNKFFTYSLAMMAVTTLFCLIVTCIVAYLTVATETEKNYLISILQKIKK